MTLTPAAVHPALERPVFLISSPRSGSTLLFQTLARAPGLCSIGNESHGVIEGLRPLHPAAHGWHSNRLLAEHATPELVTELSQRFAARLVGREGRPAQAGQRMLEKTPKNALRIPFLARAFPQATFVFLRRPAAPTLASMLEAWQSGRFRTYPRMPGWSGPLPWSLLLVPGWRALAGRPLPEVVAHQWAATMDTLLADLAALPPAQVLAIDYDAFVREPQQQVTRLCAALGLAWDADLSQGLPLSPMTVSAPDPDKWRRHQQAIDSVWPVVAQAEARAAAFLAARSA